MNNFSVKTYGSPKIQYGNSGSKRMTDLQRKLLHEFMEKHPKLKSEKYDNNFTPKVADILWQQITRILNNHPGSKKTWMMWKQSWRDIQNLQLKTGHRDTIDISTELTSDDFDNYNQDPLQIDGLTEKDRTVCGIIGNTQIKKISSVPETSTDILCTTPRKIPREMYGVKQEIDDEDFLHEVEDKVADHEYYSKKLEMMERQTVAFENLCETMQMQTEAFLELTESVKNLTAVLLKKT
ncbi:hypothetical protein DMENIID0001_065130 [Sergentomyia squamirostris]